MIDDNYRERYFSLIESFLNKNLAADDFCAQFTALWIHYGDEVYAKAATWPEPYDKLMIASFQRGEMSSSEFEREFRELWGYDAEQWKFQHGVDAIHSACSAFNSSPELEGAINEKQLRQEMEDFLAQYRKQNKPLAQAV